MGYWTIGSEGTISSWGSGNFYSNLLSKITPAAVTLYVTNEAQDVTGLNAWQAARIPGLKAARFTISGFAGATPYMGSRGAVAYGAGGYALHVNGFTFTMSTPQVHDITEKNLASPPNWRSFRPDIIQCEATYTAGIDSDTGIALPPNVGASPPTVTLTYNSSAGSSTASIAGAGIITEASPAVQKGNRNIASYRVSYTGAVTPAGGSSILGTTAFGASANADPLWTAGGSIAGAMTIQAASGRTYALTDSFLTSLTLRCEVGAPVRVEINGVASGAVTVG